MKTCLLLAVSLVLALGITRGEETVPTDAPDKQGDYNQIITNFFAKVKIEKFTDAAHVLIDTNAQDAFSVEKHEAIAVPLGKMEENFGAFKEFKPLVTKTISDEIGYVYGVGVYEKSLVRFEFMFFKDGKSWRMLHIDFSVNFADELREMAGVHFPTTPVYTAQPPQAPTPAPPAKPQVPATLSPPPSPEPAAPLVPTSPPPSPAPTPVAPVAPSTP